MKNVVVIFKLIPTSLQQNGRATKIKKKAIWNLDLSNHLLSNVCAWK